MITLERGKEYTGAQVNAANVGPFVKLTVESENHNNFLFVTGENRDVLPFNPTGECKSGGFYFCEMKYIAKWFNYACKTMHFYRTVTIPDDARVYVEKYKMKADKFILGERKSISDDGTLFHFVNMQKRINSYLDFRVFCRFFFTDEMCTTLVEQHGFDSNTCIPDQMQTEVTLLAVAKLPDLSSEDMNKAMVEFHRYLFTDAIVDMFIARGLTTEDLTTYFLYENDAFLRGFIRARRCSNLDMFDRRLVTSDLLLGVKNARITRSTTAAIASMITPVHFVDNPAVPRPKVKRPLGEEQRIQPSVKKNNRRKHRRRF